jgi:hypothetical protein
MAVGAARGAGLGLLWATAGVLLTRGGGADGRSSANTGLGTNRTSGGAANGLLCSGVGAARTGTVCGR